jgi:DNA-binding beta-propeller fold protein YncE
MNTISKLALLFISVFIISCSDDDTSAPVIPDGDYVGGTLVLNEGISAGAGASVSFLNSNLQEITNTIFASANDGEQLGVFLESIFFDDERAYIISNGSNLISVVNRFTFELIGTVNSGLSVPRYGAVFNGKAYVTNLDGFDDGLDDYIAVIDLETLEVEETVVIGRFTERILELNGSLYIQGGVFGDGNEVVKFDPATNSVIETIEVGPSINSLEAFNGQLYSLDSEGIKVIDPSSFNVVTELNQPESFEGSFSNLRIDQGQLFYTSGSSAFEISSSATELSDEPIFDYSTDSAFGVFRGFAVNNGQIYVGDAGDFESDGTVFIYSTEGQLLQEITVGGIAPNNFYFQ